MKLILMRHAEAIPGGDDFKRPLSRTGEEDAQRMASLLIATSWKIDELRASPLVRACQTRDIILKQLKKEQQTTIAKVDPRLKPGFSQKLCIDILHEIEEEEMEGSVWIFHAPEVAQIAAYLVGMREENFYFTPGCMMALNLPIPNPVERALPIWQNQPQYLRSILK